MTNRSRQWQEREHGDDRCSYPACRQEYDLRYLAGATPINPSIDVQLCEKHHRTFIEEHEAHLEAQRPPKAPVERVLDRLGA